MQLGSGPGPVVTVIKKGTSASPQRFSASSVLLPDKGNKEYVAYVQLCTI